MNLKFPIALFTLLLTIICTTSFNANANVNAKVSTKIKLALNWKAEPQFGGFYAAAEQGFFKKQGLDVEILQGGSGTPTIQMLSTGQVDAAIVSADEIIISHDRGASDVMAIFAVYQTNPQAIMSHAESGFTKLEDVFKSKEVLLWQAGLPYAQFLQKKYAPVSVKSAPYLGGIGNFQHDPQVSQQCFYTSEPLAAEKAKLKIKTFLVSDSGYNPYTTVVAVKKSYAQKNPELITKLRSAIQQGWQDYLQNSATTNKAMGILNKSMDMETFEKSAIAQKPLIETVESKKNGLGTMTLERWSALNTQLFELKVIKTKLSPEVFFQNK